MKALQVVASLNAETGGPALTVARLAEALARLQVDTTVATLDYARHGPLPALPGVRLECMTAGAVTRTLRGWNPEFAGRVAALAGAGTDVVHGHGLWMFPNLYARRAAERHGIPLVVSPRGMLDAWSLRRSRMRKSLARLLFENANLAAASLFHATSAAEARAIRAARLTQPIAMIPNGVDLPDAGTIPGRERLEARYPALRGKRWLLFLARLHPVKGVAELLRAWRALQAKNADWQLVLAGPDLDGHGEAMRRYAGELGIAARVTFTGMLGGEDKACALGCAGVFALPSHSESFGIAVAEALAHGTPALTTRAAPWQGLEQARCGWWIADDETALKATLDAVLRLPAEELRAMGLRGRDMVAREFSWQRVAGDMLAAYLWIRGRGERPAFVEAG